MRAAFIQACHLGTAFSISILDDAQKRLPTMIQDVELNEDCGNLTAVAILGAAANFSQGVVAGFTLGTSAVGSVDDGMLGLSLLVALVFPTWLMMHQV